jgi:hypothetical protein
MRSPYGGSKRGCRGRRVTDGPDAGLSAVAKSFEERLALRRRPATISRPVSVPSRTPGPSKIAGQIVAAVVQALCVTRHSRVRRSIRASPTNELGFVARPMRRSLIHYFSAAAFRLTLRDRRRLRDIRQRRFDAPLVTVVGRNAREVPWVPLVRPTSKGLAARKAGRNAVVRRTSRTPIPNFVRRSGPG